MRAGAPCQRNNFPSKFAHLAVLSTFHFATEIKSLLVSEVGGDITLHSQGRRPHGVPQLCLIRIPRAVGSSYAHSLLLEPSFLASWTKHLLRLMYQAVTRCISSRFVIQAAVECFVCGLKLGAIHPSARVFLNTISASREVNTKYPLQPLSLWQLA